MISLNAKVLVLLFNLITNLSFYHAVSVAALSPATNSYGAWVIVLPAIGGLLVALTALFGSKGGVALRTFTNRIF